MHGSALGAEEVAATKKVLGFDPDKSFEVGDDVIAHTRRLVERGREAHQSWQADFDAWAEREPERKALLDRLMEGRLPEGWDADLPHWEPGSKPLATRAASGAILSAIGPNLPELWGGSADLAGSNNTTIKGAKSFGPPSISTDDWDATWYGRTLHFGIREHAMASILSGIVLHGPTRPTVGRSCSSPTICARPCGWPPRWTSTPSTSGPTTRSVSARTAPPISRSSTSPPCVRSRGCRWCARPIPTRRPTPGGRSWSAAPPPDRPG